MYKLTLLAMCFSICIATFAQNSNLKVEGSIILSNDTNSAPVSGTIRWTGQDFEGFDGNIWRSLTCGCNGSSSNDVIINCPPSSFVLDGCMLTVNWSHDNPLSSTVNYDLRINGVDPGLSVTYPTLSNTIDICNAIGINSGSGTLDIGLLYWYDGDLDNIDTLGGCTVNYNISNNHNTGTPVLTYDLPNSALSPISNALWEQMTGNAHIFSSGNNSLTSIIVDGLDPWIQIDHPSNKVQSLSQASALPNANSYTMSQTMQFDINWAPGGPGNGSSNSGKIGFGLGGGQSSTGGLVTGGNSETTGWTVRPSFEENQFTVYAYYANRPGMPTSGTLYGHEIATGVTIVPGQTYTYQTQVVLNSPGVSNGQLNVWINGNEVVTMDNIQWMTGNPEIDRVVFSSFHGGNNILFAPPQDTWIRYKDILASTP